MLKSRYFSEDDLKEILGHNTDSSYIQKVQKNRRTQQSLKDILQTHPLYHQTNMPVWSNIRYPTQVEAEDIPDSEKSDVQKDLGIPLV